MTALARPIRLDPLIDAPLVGPRVLSLVGDFAIACNMWRVWQPAAMLQLHGYPAEWGWLRDRRNAPFLAEAEAISFCRVSWTSDRRAIAQAWVLERARRTGRKVFYECDDDLFTPFSEEHHRGRIPVPGAEPPRTDAQLRAESEAARWMLERVDGVTVTTQYLATLVRRFTDAPVAVVPNAIDAEWFLARQKHVPRPVPGVTIGWAGGNRPDVDLAAMAEAWGRVAARFPEVTFRVVGHQPPVLTEHVPESRLVRTPWLPVAEYPRGLVGLDIGCCPLEWTPFNRAKTPIKAYEYALSGAAVVASPTVYGNVIRHGQNGHLAERADEWEHALAYLLEHPEDRAEQAAALQRDVLERWSLRKNYWRWPHAWHRLAQGG
jgi:glycosyltransferase involved in cell wall biosynthesis